MNRAFTIIWDHLRQSWKVVGENARFRGRKKAALDTRFDRPMTRLRQVSRMSLLSVLIPVTAFPAEIVGQLPNHAEIMHGSAQISLAGSDMDVLQHSDLLITNWQEFSIGEDNAVRFSQPGAHAVSLNRVTGADPTKLLGQLNATGKVYVINPNGVLVGNNAHINTNEFIASTLDVSDQDFLDGGSLLFSGDSDAPVINLGTITASNGNAILVAQRVNNSGTVLAPEGVAGLAAGNEILYQPDAEQRLFIHNGNTDSQQSTGVTNSGLIKAAQAELKAAGGSVYGLAINQTGVVRAQGVEKINGRVMLTSGGGHIEHNGLVQATAYGGGGGEVLIGGDYQGQNPEVANALSVSVGEQGVIDVSSQSENADGGKAIVWSDQQTDFFGRINGQGGALGGDGAFAEVSGKSVLNYHGLADLQAPAGATGWLLLDPEQAIISSDPDDQSNGVFNNSTLAENLALANVTVDASTYTSSDNRQGEIIVNAPVSWSSNHTLQLQGNSIDINASLDGGIQGNIALLSAIREMPGLGAAAIDLDTAASLQASTLSIGHNPDAVAPPGSNFSPDSLGEILLNGTLDVGTLDLQMGTNIEGVTINNAANAIGTLVSTRTGGTLQGDLVLVNGNSDLAISGDFSNIRFGSDIKIRTAGDLSLTSGAKIASGENANIVLAATGGSFINNAGATAVTPGLNGRYLIYSDDPANTSKGGLTGLPVYNKTFSANGPDSITQTGNRFLYSLAPALTFTANDLTRGENTDNPALTYQVTGLVGGDSEAQAFTGVPSLSTTADRDSDPGNYTINIAQNTIVASDFGYTFNFVDGQLAVTSDKILNIKADDVSRYFGDSNPAFSYTPSGFEGGDDDSMLSGFTINFSTLATPNSGVGTFDIVPSGAATLDDYSVSYQNGTLTVNPRLLTITADDKSMTYLDSDPAFTASWSGLASFDDEGDVPGLNFSISSGSRNAGSYTITPTGAANANYDITFNTGTLTVNQRPITVTARNRSRIYGSANPTLSVSTLGQPGGHTVDLSGLQINTEATSTSNAGDYAITASGASNTNYAFTYVPGTLTVNPADVTITANDASREYGETNPDFTATHSGFVLGQTIDQIVPDLSFTSTATQRSNVGTYSITPTGTPSTNYNVTFDTGRLTVTKAPISLLSLGQTYRRYGDANPGSYNVNVVGLRNGDTISGGAIQIFASTTATQLSSVGTYPVTIDVASSANYHIPSSVLVSGTLVVEPRPVTITAQGFTREYGDTNPTMAATYSGLASFDTESVLTGLSFQAPSVDAPAGDYAAGVVPHSVANANYAVSYEAGDVTITPAPITVYSDSIERLYGGLNPLFRVRNVEGMKLGQDASVLGAEVSSLAEFDADVGVYDLQTSLSTGNYRVVETEGFLQILPKPVSASFPGGVSRYYGDTQVSVDGASISWLVGDDTLEEVMLFNADVDPLSPVGLYDLNPVVISPNYALSSPGVGANQFRILPRPVDVVLSGILERQYRRNSGDLSALFSVNNGLAPATQIVSLSGPGLSSDVGLYPVSVDIINPNYEINNVVGEAFLRVTPLPVLAQLQGSYSRIYGESGISDFLPGVNTLSPIYHDPADIFAVAEVSSTAGVGEYPLSLTSINPNYAVVFDHLNSDGRLRVTPRPVSVSFDSYQRPLNSEASHDFQATFGGMGLVAGDSLASDFEVTYDYPDANARIGNYPVARVSGSSANYLVDYENSKPGYVFISPSGSLSYETTTVVDLEGERAKEWLDTADERNSSIEIQRAPSYYSGRMDLWFDDFASEGHDLIRSFLESQGDNALADLIRGDAEGDITDAMINDYMASLQQPEAPGSDASEAELAAYQQAMVERGVRIGSLGPALMHFVQETAAKEASGEPLSGGEQTLAFLMRDKLEANKDNILGRIRNAREDWEATETERARNSPGSSFDGLFANDVPYDSFFESAQEEFLNDKIAQLNSLNAAVGGTVAGAAAVGVATSASVAGLMATTAIVSVIAPNLAPPATVGTGAAVGTAGTSIGGAAATMMTGVFMGATFAIVVGAMRIVQLVGQAEKEVLYNELVGGLDGGERASLADFNFSEMTDATAASSTEAINTAIDRAASMMAITDILSGF